jgi:hypothetical protein
MTGPILGLDVDSTIWDSPRFYHDALEHLTGDRGNYNEVDRWDYYFVTYGSEIAMQMFETALDPDRMTERPLYPHVKDAMREIRDMGVVPYFISHNWKAHEIEEPLTLWLHEHFGEAKVVVVDHDTSKLDILKEVGAFGVIDDKGPFIVEAAESGLWAAAKWHPHNASLVEDHPDIFVFDDWREVPAKLREVLKGPE